MSEFNSKILEVQKLLDAVNSSLQNQKIALDEAAASLVKYSSSAKIPSTYKQAQEEIMLNSKKIQEGIKKQTLLEQQAEKVKQAQIQTNIKLNQEKKSTISLSQAEERSIKSTLAANEKLNSAYTQLNNSRTKAKNTLRDLIASESASTSEIKKAQREFDILDTKVRKADKAVGDMSKSVRNYKSAFSGLSSLMGAFGIGTGIYLAVDIAKNIFETTKQLQSLDLALKMVSGSESEFASNKVFLTQVSEKWGVEIKDLTEQYTKFYTASKKIMKEADIKSTFEGVAKAGALMGLSIEKQQDAFVAFEQMMSKGKVRSEELTKQLGNAMPGAIRAAAMAYMELHPQITNVQKAEGLLMEDMKKGAIDSATYVPLIVKNFQKLYGIDTVDGVHTLQSEVNRLSNSWTELVRSLNESNSGALSSFFSGVIIEANGFLMVLNRINDSWDILYKKAEVKGNKNGEDTFNNLMGSKTGQEAIKQAEQNIRISKSAISSTVDELDKLKIQLKNINPYMLNFGKSPKSIKLEIEALKQQKAEYIALYNLSKGFLNKKEQEPLSPTETEAERKKREDKEKKDRDNSLKELEDYLKRKYELEMSAMEVTKLKIQDTIKLDETSVEDKIFLANALYYHEIAMAQKTYDEKKRIAEKENYESKLSPDKKREDLSNRIGIITNEQKKEAEKALYELQNELQKLREVDAKKTKDWYDKNPPFIMDTDQNKADRDKQISDLKEQLKKSSQVFNKFIGDFASKAGFSQTFDFLFKEDSKGVSLFDSMMDKSQKVEDRQKAMFLAISSAAQDAFNVISEASQANFEAEIQRASDQKDIALGYAGDSASAKKKIEEDYQKKVREIHNREAKAKKEQAMFNIAIDTAQAVMSVAAKGEEWMIPVMIALGAVELAMVASQKIPQYWKGTDNASEGWAMTDERGAEIHTDKYGNIKDLGSDKGSRYKYLNAGDKIFTADKTKEMLSFNSELGRILSSNNIGTSPIVINNSITKEDLDEVFAKNLGSRPSQNINFDKNGFGVYISNNGNITRDTLNRASGKGLTL